MTQALRQGFPGTNKQTLSPNYVIYPIPIAELIRYLYFKASVTTHANRVIKEVKTNDGERQGDRR